MTSKKGMSLIEVVMSLGIMSITLTVVATMMTNMQKEMRWLLLKSEVNEIKQQLVQAFSNPDICRWQLQGAGNLIDVTSTSTTVMSSSQVSLPELYSGLDNSSALLARAGERVPSSQGGLVVDSITLKDIFATGTANEYKGLLEISISDANSTRVPQPIRTSQIFTVIASDPATAKRIEDCGPVDGMSSGIPADCNVPASPESSTNKPCAAQIFRCPYASSANGVSAGPWASYGCHGQLQLSPTCYVYVYPQAQAYPCPAVGKTQIF